MNRKFSIIFFESYVVNVREWKNSSITSTILSPQFFYVLKCQLHFSYTWQPTLEMVSHFPKTENVYVDRGYISNVNRRKFKPFSPQHRKLRKFSSQKGEKEVFCCLLLFVVSYGVANSQCVRVPPENYMFCSWA